MFNRGHKKEVFKPTMSQLLYVKTRARLGDGATNIEIAGVMGINPATISKWKLDPGYEEWAEDLITQYRVPIHDVLEAKAMQHMDNFNYWAALAEKFGYLKVEMDKPNSRRLIIDFNDAKEIPNATQEGQKPEDNK